MKKIIFALLVISLLAITNTAQAKIRFTTHSTRLTSVGKYTYTLHRVERLRCPFVGCKTSLNQKY